MVMTIFTPENDSTPEYSAFPMPRDALRHYLDSEKFGLLRILSDGEEKARYTIGPEGAKSKHGHLIPRLSSEEVTE